MTTVHTLASGSSGNALLVSCGDTHLLVDAGISCRRITQSLKELALDAAELDGILITHSHSDHVSGLQTLLKRTACPVYATARTGQTLFPRAAGLRERFFPLSPCQSVLLGECTVTPFPLSHDAPGACGYRFDTDGGSIGLLTDTGYVTQEAAELLPGVDLAILESNHHVEWVESGPYPYALKQRILGSQGHLCNEDAARFAVTLAAHGASEIVLAHLSRENNTPAMAQGTVEAALSAAGLFPRLTVAPREQLSDAYDVRRSVCKK